MGNQLHGVAAGIAISTLKRVPITFNAREIPFGSNPHRRLKIDQLNLGIQDLHFDKTPLSPALGYIRFAQRKLHITSHSIKKESPRRWVDNGDEPLRQVSRIHDAEVIEGHFLDFEWAEIACQSGMKFEGLKKPTKARTRNLIREITPGSVAIHARFGDYNKNRASFPILGREYYRAALSNFDSSSECWLFTDDLQSAEKVLGRDFLSSIKVVSERDVSDLEAFLLLTKFGHIVTGNSTFSTWAAFFAEKNHGARVVTPTPHMHGAWRDQLPKTWLRVPVIQ